MQIASILVPTDFSEDSYYALDYALEMAQWRGARLTILHVNPDESALFRYLSEKEFEALRQEAIRDANRQLETLTKRFPRLREVEHNFHIRRGNPVVEILAEIEAHPVDLVVIGSHGRGSKGLEFFYGSTAEKVVRRTRSNVLVTRNPNRRRNS